jgi:sortase (surface protein transpeptidase)
VRFTRALASLAILVLAASTLAGCGDRQSRAEGVASAPTTPPSVADPWSVSPSQAPYQATAVRWQEPDPVRLELPAIGVATDVVALGLAADGTMEVPDNFGVAGWFTGGPRPGENGPAVIAGHVDSRAGPAVFYKLRELQPGAAVFVTRVDGSAVTFTVSRVETYDKATFPTDAVFGATAGSELRLVTCGGEFDWGRRTYRSNIVVYARRDR